MLCNVVRYINEIGGIVITDDEGVDHYLERGEMYQRAVNGEFGEVEPYIPPPEPTPEQLLEQERNNMVVTAVQAHIAIEESGIDLTAALASNRRLEIAFERNVTFRRTNVNLIAMLNAVGLDDAAIDDLFRTAMTIEV